MNRTELHSYLVQQKLIPPNERVKISLLSGGYINSVFSVETKTGRFIVKIYQEKASSGFDLSAPKERALFEVRALQEMNHRGIDCVPKLLQFDNKNFIAILSHAPLNSKNYNTQLLNGKIDVDIPSLIGKFSAELHSKTLHDSQLRQAFKNNPGYLNLRYKASLELPMLRNNEIAAELKRTFEKNEKNKWCLIHADTTPKNVLVHNGAITILDFECATFGDPAHDVGITLAHYFMLAIGNPQQAQQYLSCADIFYSAYKNNIEFTLPKTFFSNMKNNAAAMMLGRIDGVIEFDYLKDKKELVRTMCKHILRQEFADLAHLISYLQRKTRLSNHFNF